MYAVLIWNDLEGDFIYYLDEDNKKVMFESWADAGEKAAQVAFKTGEQTKVTFVRNTRGPKKTNRSGRIKRFNTAMLDGERVKIIGVVNGKGEKVK